MSLYGLYVMHLPHVWVPYMAKGVFEMETIAIFKALLIWKDKLLGHQINIITNHHTLESFKTQWQLSSRQYHWMEYLSWFNFNIQYIRGTSNKVADSLFQYLSVWYLGWYASQAQFHISGPATWPQWRRPTLEPHHQNTIQLNILWLWNSEPAFEGGYWRTWTRITKNKCHVYVYCSYPRFSTWDWW